MGDFVSYHPLTKDSRLTYVVKFRIAKGIEKGALPVPAASMIFRFFLSIS